MVPSDAMDPLAALEAAYLAARDARDRLDVARATGVPEDASALERAAAEAERAARDALAGLETALGEGAILQPDDERALAAIRHGFGTALGPETALPVAPEASPAECSDGAATAAAIAEGGATLHRRLEACYGAVAGALSVRGGAETLTRPQVLARLATEPDPAARRGLFLALEPLWRAVDGDGGDRSPYQALVRESAARWAGAPPDRRQRVGARPPGRRGRVVGGGDARRLARRGRGAARARGEPPVEPWDWWWVAGEADRTLRPSSPRAPVRRHAPRPRGLGADLDALGVRFDTVPRPGRPPLPVAFTTFGARPVRTGEGTWSPGSRPSSRRTSTAAWAADRARPRGGARDPHRGDPDAPGVRGLARFGRPDRGARGAHRPRRQRAGLAAPLAARRPAGR
jgi:hypothetical protein